MQTRCCEVRHQQIYGSSVETDFVRATLKSFLKSGLARCAAVGSSRDDLKKVMGLVGVDAKALAAGRATSGGEDDPAADAAVAAAAAASDEAQLLELLQSASIQTDALEAYVRLLRTGSSEGVAGHRFEQWRRVSDVWSMDGGAAPFAFDACQADEMSAAVIRAHALYYANVLRADFPAYSAATKQADGAIARAMAACATRSEQPTRAELRHRVAAGELLKKLITDEVVHHGLARTATSVYAVCVSNAALRVATAVHARRTRPSDGSDTAPAVVVSGATRTEFFSRAQQLSGEDAIARLFHRVWQAVVAEIGTDVDDKATSFFRPIESDGFTSLITRIRARCEGSKTASHALVAAVVPLFVQQRPASSAPRDGAVDSALVGEMLDEVLDTIEGCVACARACRCAEGLVRRLLHRTLLTPLSFLSLSLSSLPPTHRRSFALVLQQSLDAAFDLLTLQVRAKVFATGKPELLGKLSLGIGAMTATFCNNFLELIDDAGIEDGVVDVGDVAPPSSREYAVCAEAVGVAMAAVRRLSANVYDC